MAKKKRKNSNDYWMKFGGSPRKMHKGGFTHPHPHPKDASDAELRGAQLFSTTRFGNEEDGYNAMKKRVNYDFGDDDQNADFSAFQNSAWYNFFPDTLKDVPKTIKQLNEYEEKIGAQRTRTIELYETDFDWSDVGTYGGGAAAWFGASHVPQSVPTPWTQALGGIMKGIGLGLAGGKGVYDWWKRGENEELKKENPYATFVDSKGNILNYEDGNGMFFDLFHPNNKNLVINKNIRETPPPIETTDDYVPENPITFEMGGHTDLNKPKTKIQDDPTFKMWFAKNARRPDVLQAMSSPEGLKTIFLNDIKFPGNEMPLFSGEIDGYGNVDKSKRSMDLSEKIIGGMQKYGGMPKAELGMGTGLYESPTDYVRDYSGVNETGLDGRNANTNLLIGSAGEEGTFQNYVLKAFNYVIPGLGTGLDMVADIFGHQGAKEQHYDNIEDANEAINSARAITATGANKETLDLSTRLGGLEAVSSYLGTDAPEFDWGNFAKQVVDIAGNYTGGGGGMGTDSPVDYNNIGAEDLQIDESLYAKYGGHTPHFKPRPKRQMGGGGAKPPEGALAFQPGYIDIIGHQFNPMGNAQRFEAQGATGQSFNDGGATQNTQEFEAEGGEAILHQPGDVPVTTAPTEQVDGDMNEAMVTMLGGKSHEKGGEIVQSSEGQYVFSKSLSSKTWGMSYADAAEKIGTHIAKFKTEMEDGDAITKSTAASMIEAWNQKLTDLQTEQEASRKEKFMDLLNSGADEQELQEKFPDIYQQFMQQQQQANLSESAMQSIAGPMGGQPDNPMGNIDVSQLSADEQALVGAKYGLPQMDNGGFDPYDFNRYFGSVMGNDFDAFSLDKNYQPKKSDLMDFLTANYPDGGWNFGEGSDMMTFENNKDMYKALMKGFGDWRGTQLEDEGIPTSKPRRDDYMTEIGTGYFEDDGTEIMDIDWEAWENSGKGEFTQDKNQFNLYNMGLGVDWNENFGADAGMSKRKYFKALETSLLAEGKSPADVRAILDRERIKYDENSALESVEGEEELSPEEKAAALAKKFEQRKKMQQIMNGLKTGANSLMNLAPTLYNFNKAKQGVEYEPFVENENQSLIDENIKRLTNSLDIQSILEENEQNFNSLKYLSRDLSDGSSANAMNILLRGQNIQNESDLKAYLTEAQLEQQGLQIANESLFNLGERDRQEGVRQNEANAMNRAAHEAFKAKGWEGLSGYNQLKQKMGNEMAQDKNLAKMLNMIYPDAHLYMNKNGTMDIPALIQSGDLDELIKKYPQLKSYIEKYFNNNKTEE